MSAEFQYNVFLGHSAKDKAVVRPLAERLRADGQVFKAKGQRLKAKVELQPSAVSLQPFLRAFGSDWTQLEAGTCGRGNWWERRLAVREPLNQEHRFILLRLDFKRDRSLPGDGTAANRKLWQPIAAGHRGVQLTADSLTHKHHSKWCAPIHRPRVPKTNMKPILRWLAIISLHLGVVAHAFCPSDMLRPFLGQSSGATHKSITEAAVWSFTRDLGYNYVADDALSQIVNGARSVDSREERTLPQCHFDGETFEQSQLRILWRRQEVINALLDCRPCEARIHLGKALHTVQDFYSHSNWPELGNTEPHPAVGVVYPREVFWIAPPDAPTCSGSTLIQAGLGMLTSGYFGGDGIPKPPGKCSHGGPLDSFGLNGLNKDTGGQVYVIPSFVSGIPLPLNVTFSPHWQYHAIAASLATQASKKFLNELNEDLWNAQRPWLVGMLLGVQARSLPGGTISLSSGTGGTFLLGEYVRLANNSGTSYTVGKNVRVPPCGTVNLDVQGCVPGTAHELIIMLDTYSQPNQPPVVDFSVRGPPSWSPCCYSGYLSNISAGWTTSRDLAFRTPLLPQPDCSRVVVQSVTAEPHGSFNKTSDEENAKGLTFSAAFLLEMTGDLGHSADLLPIHGMPVAGATNFVETTFYSSLSNATFEFRSTNGDLLQTNVAVRGTGETEYKLLGWCRIPSVPFFISVAGTLGTSAVSAVISPDKFPTAMQLIPPSERMTQPGGKIALAFEAKNLGGSNQFHFQCQDTLNFLSTLGPSNATLRSGDALQVMVEVLVPSNAVPYSVDTVTLSGWSSGEFGCTNSVSVPIEVYPEPKVTIVRVSNTELELRWNRGLLEFASSLTGPWQRGAATSPMRLYLGAIMFVRAVVEE